MSPAAGDNGDLGRETGTVSPAKERWIAATKIAKRAGSDDRSSPSSNTSGSDEEDIDSLTREQRAERRKKRQLANEARKKTGKMMDLQYFLELVDQKHRYGSNLRKYHNYWKTQNTNQSFFYWLDQGDGKDVELEECSRERLEKMQVRYLSREERLNYLVKIDDDGLLVWAKNGERVWTKDELYRDSVKGIVPTTDPTPEFKYNIKPENYESSGSDLESEGNDSDSSKDEADEGAAYVNEEFHRAKGPAKLKHVTAAALFNHMIRKSLRKGHKWIFVADTSFRLYIGYKQSGAFQHSSFLHGSRITAAGLIKVKDGQLRSLAPLSGHYRPPAANFRSFVHSLKEEGVDMSRVNISKSYAVLVGIEGYTKTRKRVKEAENTVTHEFNKVARPEKAKKEEEERRDKSKSAEVERQYLERQRLKQEAERKRMSPHRKLSSRLSRAMRRLTGKKEGEEEPFSQDRGVPGGMGPEDGVPAPEGKR